MALQWEQTHYYAFTFYPWQRNSRIWNPRLMLRSSFNTFGTNFEISFSHCYTFKYILH